METGTLASPKFLPRITRKEPVCRSRPEDPVDETLENHRGHPHQPGWNKTIQSASAIFRSVPNDTSGRAATRVISSNCSIGLNVSA